MGSAKRISKVYQSAVKIPFSDTSKFILFSDCHRGDNSFADEFANNRNLYFHALKHYYANNFTYIELGDGDELWEHKSFSTLFEAHSNVYQLLKDFFNENRWLRIYGNHDIVYRNPKYVAKHLHTFFNKITGNIEPLFPNATFHEGIILEHEKTKQELFLLHGHQADWMNYHGWRINRFLVQALWKPLQIFGIGDPTSPAKNYKELIKVERRFKKWIKENNNVLTVIGHTHRPRFPEPNEIPLFNDGSCVHPRSITGIEIENGAIVLIKWYIATTNEGILKIERKQLEGPIDLINYLKH